MYQLINQEAFNKIVSVSSGSCMVDYIALKNITSTKAKQLIRSNDLATTIEGCGVAKFVRVTKIVPTFVISCDTLISLNSIISNAIKEEKIDWWNTKKYSEWKTKTSNQFRSESNLKQYEQFKRFCSTFIKENGVKRVEIVYERGTNCDTFSSPCDLDNIFKSIIDFYMKEINYVLKSSEGEGNFDSVDDSQLTRIVGQKIDNDSISKHRVYVRFY